MRDREPTIRSRELGDGLRRAMDKAGLNGVQAAHKLGWSPSMVSRLLSGKRGGNEVDVSAHGGVRGEGQGASPAARALPGAAHPGLVPAARLPAAQAGSPVSYTHLTLPTKRIV